MPRNYKRKTAPNNSEDLKAAVNAVIGGMSIRRAAIEYKLKKSTLQNYVSKTRKVGLENQEEIRYAPDPEKKQIFSRAHEEALSTYLLRASSMFHGLTTTLFRRLAFEFGKSNSVQMPQSWHEKEFASKDWMRFFLKRHAQLSIRQPEATSLARISSFNPHAVAEFMAKLRDVKLRFKFSAERIFNLDETGVSTVQKLPKVIAKKGLHQVGQVTSRERGELVTNVGIISAAGQALPLTFVFPRQKFDEQRMMKGVSNAAVGLVHPSGWMNSPNFVKVLQWLIKYVNASRERPILLIMDNHQSHLSIEGLNICKDNGVVVLTLWPHTSNKMQPLDVAVFGPFKSFVSQAMNSWMLGNPGKTLSIYDLPQLCVQAWDRAATPTNIKSGFRATGIEPFDENIFTEVDFAPSLVTDRPNPSETAPTPQTPTRQAAASPSLVTDRPNPSEMVPTPQTPTRQVAASPSLVTDRPNPSEITPTRQVAVSPLESASMAGQLQPSFTPPEVVRPFPKAAERKPTSRARGKCMVATDTPEKAAIEAKKAMQVAKAEKKSNAARKKAVKRKILNETEELNCGDHVSAQVVASDDEPMPSTPPALNRNDVKQGDFVVVNYNSSKYPGQVCAISTHEVELNCMEKALKSWRWPQRPDQSFYSWDNVLFAIKTPTPISKRNQYRVPELEDEVY